MRPKDPFAHQREVKSENRRVILTRIEAESSTFGELEQKTGLSRPVLTKHLRELEKEGKVERRIRGPRIEYELTSKGGALEQQGVKNLANAFQFVKQLTRDYDAAQTLFNIFKLSKDAPELLDAFTRWLGDFTAFILSDEYLEWTKKHPGLEGRRLMETELAKRGAVPIKLQGASIFVDESAEILTTFQTILDSMRDVVRYRKG